MIILAYVIGKILIAEDTRALALLSAENFLPLLIRKHVDRQIREKPVFI